MKATIALPNTREVELHFYGGAADEFVGVLQGKRSNRVKPSQHRLDAYARMIGFIGRRLASGLTGRFDAIVSPPSRHADAEPYRKMIKSLADVDLTACLKGNHTIQAADDSTTVQQLKSTWTLSTDYNCSSIRRLLIVDESVARGRTIQAIIETLEAAGMPSSAEVVVVAPLYVQQKSD